MAAVLIAVFVILLMAVLVLFYPAQKMPSASHDPSDNRPSVFLTGLVAIMICFVLFAFMLRGCR